MAGVASAQYGGPTPWWQLPEYQKNPMRNNAGPGGAGTSNPVTVLQSQAPPGFEYDPISMQYQRTPTNVGERAGQVTQGYMSSVPALGGLTGALSGSASGTGSGVPSGAGGTLPGIPGGPGGGIGAGGYVPPIAPPDNTAAQNAAFARAKDTVGQTGRAALTGLNDALASSGLLGSGAQVQGARDITEFGAGQLGDVANQQAIDQAAQAADFAKTGYQGAITQRGQDINAQEAQARLALEANQAAQRNQLQMLQMALGGLQALGPSGAGQGSLSGMWY